MVLYTEPPGGVVSYSKLCSFCIKRMKFLVDVAQCDGKHTAMWELVNKHVESSDCLIEGSKKDAISHFVLRLLCSGNSSLSKFFIRAETLLFSFRFSCMNRSELVSFMQQLQRFLHKTHSTDQGKCPDSLQGLLKVMSHILNTTTVNDLVDLYVDGSTKDSIGIPFQCVLDMVAKRAVSLHEGVAYVPCGKLCDLMTTVYGQLLQSGINTAKQKFASAMEDVRYKRLCDHVKWLFMKEHRFGSSAGLGAIHHEEVDHLMEFFPPCMAHLHRKLRANHRLQHFSRVQYTLFLKEVGLPVHEGVHFWRKEYTQQCTDKHGCQHDWQRDGRRYTYSIRHLYGLEGSRINYRAHCCQSLQQMSLGAGETGGCPFTHFDRDHLKELLDLDRLTSGQMQDIMSAVDHGQYTEACRCFLQARMQNSSGLQKSIMCEENIDSVHEITTAGEKQINGYASLNHQMAAPTEQADNSSTNSQQMGLQTASKDLHFQSCVAGMEKNHPDEQINLTSSYSGLTGDLRCDMKHSINLDVLCSCVNCTHEGSEYSIDAKLLNKRKLNCGAQNHKSVCEACVKRRRTNNFTNLCNHQLRTTFYNCHDEDQVKIGNDHSKVSVMNNSRQNDDCSSVTEGESCKNDKTDNLREPEKSGYMRIRLEKPVDFYTSFQLLKEGLT